MGLGFVRWGSMALEWHRECPYRLRHSMGEVTVLLCPAQKAVSRLRCCLGGGEHLQALLPLNTKGDDAADTEASELGSLASGFQKKTTSTSQGCGSPLLAGHPPPDKMAVRPTSPIAWADGGPSCEVDPVCAVVTVASLPQELHAHQHSPLRGYNPC